jgi:hypothetical protein
VTTSDCTITLWCNFTGKVQLIDNTFVEGLSETPKKRQKETTNLVNDKFSFLSSEVTTTLTNYETTVTPENKAGPRYLTSEITMNPTKLTTGNGIRNTTLREKSGSNTTVTDKTNDIDHKVDDDLTINTALIDIIVLIVILCILGALVGTFYYFKRCHQKNTTNNNIDSTEKIMLMPVPSLAIVRNIKIEFLESYIKKTMVSSRNIENQFCVSGAPTVADRQSRTSLIKKFS